jgi:hypothetical protein
MRGWLVRNRHSRESAIDGVNLFFGALLGANLGTLSGVKLSHYVEIIAVLASTVIALRMVSAADRRAPALVLLGFYALVLVGVALIPGLQPVGMRADDLHKLLATMAVWVMLALVIELAPAKSEPAPAQPS